MFIDPNNEPVRVADHATFHPPRGPHLDLTLCALVPFVDEDNRTTMENVVTTRLRFDVVMAKGLIQGLMQQVAMIEASDSTKN